MYTAARMIDLRPAFLTPMPTRALQDEVEQRGVCIRTMTKFLDALLDIVIV